MGGYYLFFWALKVQANKELSLKLDEGEYNKDETFEIKIPVALPYPLKTTDYERQTGQFVYKNEHYQMVKQKYENDTITIVCVKDMKNTHLATVMDSFSEASGNQPLEDGSLNIPMKVLQEFVSSLSATISGKNGWSQPIEHTPYFNNFNAIPLATLSPPPWA
jgi:hypothetical protein